MADYLYDFGAGRSDPSTFPTKALSEAAVRVIEEQSLEITTYPGNLGHLGLREAMARREGEREGVSIDPDQIILTNGSMQGVTLTAEALQEHHGDTVIVEEFCYPGTLSAYRSLKYEMHGIPLDENGMRLDCLADKLAELDKAKKLPKFIYAISTYQNPTGFVMPKQNRLELIALGKKYDISIVEDNCYGDVHYEGPIEPALFALDDGEDQIYLGSLSKILAPGLRLGYIIARGSMMDKILARRHDAGGNYLAAAIAAEFYKNGIAEHAAVSNPVLKNKRDLCVNGLAEHLEDLCAWSNPVGGLFIWVRVPDDLDRKKLYQLTQEQGLNYLPGASFHFETKNKPYLRLAFGHLTEEQIVAGVPVLANCIRQCRTSNEAKGFTNLFD